MRHRHAPLRLDTKIRGQIAMGYDHTAPGRQINITRNADVLRQAEALPGSLDEMVKSLLAAHNDAAQARHDDHRAKLRQWAEASGARVARYGIPGEGDERF